MRLSTRTWAAVVAIIVAVAAIGAVALSGDRGRDCESFHFDRAAWDATRGDLRRERETRSERTRGALAQDLVRCGGLIGRSRAQIIALLGQPDGSGTVVGGRDRYIDYLVGYRHPNHSADEESQSLFIQFDTTGRVVWVEAPGSRDNPNDTVTSSSG
jgi:hypothetical protein